MHEQVYYAVIALRWESTAFIEIASLRANAVDAWPTGEFDLGNININNDEDEGVAAANNDD